MSSTINPDNTYNDEGDKNNNTLPECIQQILTGNDDDRSCCSQCRGQDVERVLRCSRCRVAHYCSIECQKRHFPFHKAGCKRIARLLQSHESQDILADSLVVLGYRETDTISNGSYYYRKALYYYLERFQKMGSLEDDDSAASTILSLEDKILFLMIVLGGNQKVMMEWCCKVSKSPRSTYYNNNTGGDTTQLFQAQGLMKNDATYQCLCLLAAMRSLAEYRREQNVTTTIEDAERNLSLETAPKLNNNNEIQSYLLSAIEKSDDGDGRIDDLLSKEIRLLICAIRHHGTEEYLTHLRDTIPLTPAHAPKLLSGGGNTDSNDDGLAPMEFWYLYQDCFFLTPGLNNVLHEFLPEEDEEEEEEY